MAHKPLIGVLALQGGFAKHIAMLKKLGTTVREIRKPEDLLDCDGLIIPGGESTTIFKQMAFIKMQDALHAFMEKKAVFGTCAGLILLSTTILNSDMEPFKKIDVTIERNAFGRQADSFKVPVEMRLGREKTRLFPAIFIRAPRIKEHGETVQVLARYNGEAILVQQGCNLGATFHPELTDDSSVHAYFLSLVNQMKKAQH